MSRGWLLDTNVVSELFKGHRADPSVIDWVSRVEESDLYVSVITLGELAKGIALAEARGRDMRRQRLFLDEALPARFGERLLVFDAAAAKAWARLLHRLRGNREEERVLAIDAQIAAAAEAASLTICTRNQRDFVRLGVTDLVNPFAAG